MGPLAAYSIKSAILLSALFAIYMLTLGRQKLPALRRFTLLGICIASLAIPTIYIHGERESAVNTVIVDTMPTPTVITSENFTPFIYTIIAAIITAGICAGAIISIAGLVRLLTMRTTTAYVGGHRLKIMKHANSSPFCFCGSIYISAADLSGVPEMILTHENSHLRHLHFADLLIGRIVLILQWWNPLAWMMVREIQLVHEYQADTDVLNAGYDGKEYQYLLLGRATGDTKHGLTNGFRHSELKRRLKMINRNRAGRRNVALALLLIPASLITFALQTSPIILQVNKTFTPVRLSSLRNEPRKDTSRTMDGAPYVILDGTPIPYGEINIMNPDAIESISVWKDQPEYPYGVIEIKTKPGKDIFKPIDSQKPEGIQVIGAVAAEKKGL